MLSWKNIFCLTLIQDRLLRLKPRNDVRAFTLAEVLITLGIIGVVAGMTIPTLMHSTQEQEFKTGYKKAFSVISQAFQRAQADQSLVTFSGSNGGLGFQENFQALKQYFSIAKECTLAHLSDCWDTSSNSDTYRNESTSNAPSFVDKSGMAWRVRTYPDNEGSTPTILVDINGSKKPNKYGQDRFPIFFSTNGINNTGIPTKIIPRQDILSTDSGSSDQCPSYATHPCYYTKWLYN